ncbi:TonB family protein [Hymenobacter ruricola]|uniref:TonB family protein n=1 Tax=Hymenobacter ruricola TaxID=2791023 RepID=A0ABS0IA91_9BACT|nr:M56 family metallopeptidase [Hymenobacter ruricola]MBF9223886.1 TonB family protein [Hymenobacter ruricola]
MNPTSLLNWMLLSTVLLGAWWLCYRLALRQEHSFAYNRVFLGLGPLLAAGLPLLPAAWLSGWGAGPVPLAGAVSVLLPPAAVSAEGAGAPALSWAVGLVAVYVAGAVFMLGRLIFGLGRLWWRTRRLPREAGPGHTLARTQGRLPTSSFGRTVFWDETLALSPAEAAQVLRHELAHVRQGHTYDRLLLELLQAVLWFNPFVHLCGRALALTHEFLADEAALRPAADAAGAPAQTYTHLLARQVAIRLGFATPLAHSFSHSQTLSRIAMIQKTSPVRRWKQWLALPLAGVLVLAVACEKATPKAEPAAAAAAQPAVAPPPPQMVYETVDQMPALPGGGGSEAIVGAIQQHLDYPAVAPRDRKSGTSFVTFVVSDQGEVQAVKVLKSLGPAYDAAVIAAIQRLPVFVPGRKEGKAVAVSFTVPIQFVWRSTVRVSGALPLNWRGWALESPGLVGC